MSEDYRLFVNEDRTVMVRLWPATEVERTEFGVSDTAEFATREHPDAVWGPPVVLKEEGSDDR